MKSFQFVKTLKESFSKLKFDMYNTINIFNSSITFTHNVIIIYYQKSF